MEQTRSVQLTIGGEAPVRMNLKPERVQQLLMGLPGWQLRADGGGLATERTFTRPSAAGVFAAEACRLATLRRQPVKIHLEGAAVVVTLRGHPARGCTGGITEAVFNLAELIGV